MDAVRDSRVSASFGVFVVMRPAKLLSRWPTVANDGYVSGTKLREGPQSGRLKMTM